MPKFGAKNTVKFGTVTEKSDGIKRIGTHKGVTLGLSAYKGSVNAVLEFPGARAMFLTVEKLEWLAEHGADALKALTADDGVDIPNS
jgi:hypothetical protein